MKEDSDQKERCNKKAEGKFGFFEDCQSDTTSKKAKKRSLYKQNIFCSSELQSPAPALLRRGLSWYNGRKAERMGGLWRFIQMLWNKAVMIFIRKMRII